MKKYNSPTTEYLVVKPMLCDPPSAGNGYQGSYPGAPGGSPSVPTAPAPARARRLYV